MADEKSKKTKRPTALKRDITNEKKRQNNRAFKSRARTIMRGFESAVSSKDAASMKENLKNVYKLMDKGVKLGIYKKNKAARTKSNCSAKLA